MGTPKLEGRVSGGGGRKRNSQQGLFQDTEQFLCKCGCGQYGFRRAVGRKREYLNATHKKRAQRARRGAGSLNDVYTLTPKGKRLAARIAAKSAADKWDALTFDQQHALYLLSQHPSGFNAALEAIVSLLPRATGYVADIQHENRDWDHG